MMGSSGKLWILIRTNLIVLNREAPNAFMSYLTYALGGMIFSAVAIVPVIGPNSSSAAGAPLIFLLVVFMFDYLNLQVLLTRATLIDRSILGLFPLSGIWSGAIRFILMLLNRRILFYMIPVAVVVSTLFAKGEPAQALAMILLFGSLYLVLSGILFGMYPVFRAIAGRYSARTAMQIAMIPLLFVLFFPGLFQLSHRLVLRIPVAAEFVEGVRFILASDFTGGMLEVARLFLAALMLGGLLAAASFLLARVDPILHRVLTRKALALRRKADREPAAMGSGKKLLSVSKDRASAPDSSRATGLGRLILLDWQIRQKEEKFFFVILINPVLAFLLAQVIAPGFNRFLSSVILPVFIVTQMIGFLIIENGYTQRGLRLKHVSTLPVDPTKFVRIKFYSEWIPIVAGNLAVAFFIGLRSGITYYEGIQGIIYSLFIPFVLMLANDSLVLAFNSLSRHTIVSTFLILILEIVGTLVYVLLMVFNFALGAVCVSAFCAVSYFKWMPALGERLSSGFQTLLEESK